MARARWLGQNLLKKLLAKRLNHPQVPGGALHGRWLAAAKSSCASKACVWCTSWKAITS